MYENKLKLFKIIENNYQRSKCIFQLIMYTIPRSQSVIFPFSFGLGNNFVFYFFYPYYNEILPPLLFSPSIIVLINLSNIILFYLKLSLPPVILKKM